VHILEIVIIRVHFYTPVIVFLLFCAPALGRNVLPIFCFMTQKTCFHVIYVLFVVRTKIVNIFHYF